MSAEIHKYDIGTAFTITVYDENDTVVNVSGALTKDILFTKPDNTVLTKSATLVNNGESGVMQYVTQSGDLDTVGIWKIQGHIEFNSSSYNLYTNIASFRVYDNLE